MDYQERRKEQSDRTVAAILKAATELARESSFENVSIRDICRRAGITTGAFYHHFPSKNAMLGQGFTPLDAHLVALMTLHEGEPPLDRLWALLSGYAKFMEDMGCALVARYYEHRLNTPSSATMDPTRFTHRAMLDCLTAIQTEGGLAGGFSPEWVAEFLFRHFRGVVVDWVLREGGYPLVPKLEQDYHFFKAVLERPVE